jgi:flagellar motor protein MotB
MALGMGRSSAGRFERCFGSWRVSPHQSLREAVDVARVYRSCFQEPLTRLRQVFVQLQLISSSINANFRVLSTKKNDPLNAPTQSYSKAPFSPYSRPHDGKQSNSYQYTHPSARKRPYFFPPFAARLITYILNPFFKMRMSPYSLPRISNLPGATLNAQAPLGLLAPSWKHSQKWPGYLGMLQKAYMERLGLAVQ